MTPSIGRIVHYIVPAGLSAGKHLAAIITSIESNPAPDLTSTDSSLANLRVFEDQKEDLRGHDRLRGVSQDPAGLKPGTWHECERAPAPADALARVEAECAAASPGDAPVTGSSGSGQSVTVHFDAAPGRQDPPEAAPAAPVLAPEPPAAPPAAAAEPAPAAEQNQLAEAALS